MVATRHDARAGRVWLVGAGPGDPELMTLKAVRVLAEADVVLVDDLVDRRVLTHVRAGARVIQVGKRGGCRSTPQAFIELLLVREANCGHRVVRLKGGDPSVFGRAAEELHACRRAGIVCDVVPGVTSASAAAAAIGAPLTDRAYGHGVALVTGHTRDASERHDWGALVASGLTLVIYMGLGNAASIVDALMRAGRPASFPVAVVERASLAEQQVHHTNLAGLVDLLGARSVRSPALLVVGEVAAVDLTAVVPAFDAASRIPA